MVMPEKPSSVECTPSSMVFTSHKYGDTHGMTTIQAGLLTVDGKGRKKNTPYSLPRSHEDDDMVKCNN